MTSATSGLTKSRIVAIQIYHTVPTSNLHLHRTAPPWWQKIAKPVRIQGCDVERMQWNVLSGQDYFRDREATALSSELFLCSESFDAHSWTFDAAFFVAFASVVGPSLVNLASILVLKLLAFCAQTHIFLHSVFSHCLYDSSSRQCQRERPLVKHYATLQPVNARSQKSPPMRSLWTGDYNCALSRNTAQLTDHKQLNVKLYTNVKTPSPHGTFVVQCKCILRTLFHEETC